MCVEVFKKDGRDFTRRWPTVSAPTLDGIRIGEFMDRIPKVWVRDGARATRARRPAREDSNSVKSFVLLLRQFAESCQDLSSARVGCRSLCEMPSHDHCCVPLPPVPLCTNRRDRRKDLSFQTFPPSDVLSLKRRWIHAIRRDEGPTFQVSANTVVCSEHFLPLDYTSSFSSPSDGEPDSKRRYRRLSRGVASKRV